MLATSTARPKMTCMMIMLKKRIPQGELAFIPDQLMRLSRYWRSTPRPPEPSSNLSPKEVHSPKRVDRDPKAGTNSRMKQKNLIKIIGKINSARRVEPKATHTGPTFASPLIIKMIPSPSHQRQVPNPRRKFYHKFLEKQTSIARLLSIWLLPLKN